MTAQSAPVRATRARQPMAKPVVTPAMEAPASPPPAPIVPVPAIVDTAPDIAAEYPAGFVRRPFGSRNQKLDNSERAGFHRHWFNDKGSRISDALAAGYKHVLDKDGQPMKRVVGTGEQGMGLAAYRMEIPIEWFNEDQKAKETANAEILRQIKEGVVAGTMPGVDGAYRPVNKSGTIGADIKMHGK